MLGPRWAERRARPARAARHHAAGDAPARQAHRRARRCALFRSFYAARPRASTRCSRSCRSRTSATRAYEQALRRAEAAARRRLRARRRPRAALPRRADDRASIRSRAASSGTSSSRFKRAGGTVLLTTHYMDEAERLCDRVAVVDHGKVIALGTPRELIASLGGEQVIEFAARAPRRSTARRARARSPASRGVRREADGLALTVERAPRRAAGAARARWRRRARRSRASRPTTPRSRTSSCPHREAAP